MISIPDTLRRLAEKKGVKFVFNSRVNNIVTDSGRVTGIVANGVFIPAATVVSNVDAYFTYKNLLEREDGVRKVLRNERSSSALIFYWGINREFSNLHLHNIFFSEDYKKEFAAIWEQQAVDVDPTIYINISSKYQTEDAPKGAENWFVMINVPANTGQNWDKLIAEARKNILQKLSRMLNRDIAPLIVNEEILDPRSIEQKTASYQGSLYGTSSNNQFAAFLRHANFSSKIKELYFVGGSVHPGGGIPLALLSAKIVDDLSA
jgi:phytoene dehydrogenase-like protein